VYSGRVHNNKIEETEASGLIYCGYSTPLHISIVIENDQVKGKVTPVTGREDP
jgi:hypothetical protein